MPKTFFFAKYDFNLICEKNAKIFFKGGEMHKFCENNTEEKQLVLISYKVSLRNTLLQLWFCGIQSTNFRQQKINKRKSKISQLTGIRN